MTRGTRVEFHENEWTAQSYLTGEIFRSASQ